MNTRGRRAPSTGHSRQASGSAREATRSFTFEHGTLERRSRQRDGRPGGTIDHGRRPWSYCLLPWRKWRSRSSRRRAWRPWSACAGLVVPYVSRASGNLSLRSFHRRQNVPPASGSVRCVERSRSEGTSWRRQANWSGGKRSSEPAPRHPHLVVEPRRARATHPACRRALSDDRNQLWLSPITVWEFLC